jgi:hypothetical protein
MFFWISKSVIGQAFGFGRLSSMHFNSRFGGTLDLLTSHGRREGHSKHPFKPLHHQLMCAPLNGSVNRKMSTYCNSPLSNRNTTVRQNTGYSDVPNELVSWATRGVNVGHHIVNVSIGKNIRLVRHRSSRRGTGQGFVPGGFDRSIPIRRVDHTTLANL